MIRHDMSRQPHTSHENNFLEAQGGRTSLLLFVTNWYYLRSKTT
jgi:hypothetical protein